ncbi:MAG: site-specific integrase [Oscillospiraceae bacterium]|nr:site-specific integrase [Oscillospiraceae bacterium]
MRKHNIDLAETSATTEKTDIKDMVERYAAHLRAKERAEETVKKYIRDIGDLSKFLGGKKITKEAALEWKSKLRETRAAVSVNSMLAAVNGFFEWCELDIKIKPYKIQRQTFLLEKKELCREEYERLLAAATAQKNERLFYVMETLCATGIRVGELSCITVEAAKAGQAEIVGKGKTRTAFIANDLREALLGYAKRQGIKSGHIFVTKSGKPLNRSNIWAEMKKLCKAARINPSKVFPHNLRALFSRVFYSANKDLAKLADMLGHSSVETTRLYIMESGAQHRKAVENLGLARMRYT